MIGVPPAGSELVGRAAVDPAARSVDRVVREELLYPAETSLAQAKRDQLLAGVNLYKALGGGWELQ